MQAWLLTSTQGSCREQKGGGRQIRHPKLFDQKAGNYENQLSVVIDKSEKS